MGQLTTHQLPTHTLWANRRKDPTTPTKYMTRIGKRAPKPPSLLCSNRTEKGSACLAWEKDPSTTVPPTTSSSLWTLHLCVCSKQKGKTDRQTSRHVFLASNTKPTSHLSTKWWKKQKKSSWEKSKDNTRETHWRCKSFVFFTIPHSAGSGSEARFEQYPRWDPGRKLDVRMF